MSNKRKIITLGVASVSAIFAAFIARDFIAGGAQPEPQKVVVQQAENVDVLTINKDAQFGEVIQPAMLEWRPWPKDHLLPGMISRDSEPEAIDKLAGSRVRAPMVAGEPVMNNKIINKEQGGLLSTLVPKNMRAVAIPVTLDTDAGGYIMPNDRVDVILARQVKGKYLADTVLENVRVLAIDQVYAGENSDDPSLEEVATATLEVTPEQARVLAKVQKEDDSTLHLALRSLDEHKGKSQADLKPRLNPKFAKSAAGGVRIIRYGASTTQVVNN